MRNLIAKQNRFADEHLVDPNGAQAAAKAGYSPHTARITAVKLLAKASVRTAVEAAMRERS